MFEGDGPQVTVNDLQLKMHNIILLKLILIKLDNKVGHQASTGSMNENPVQNKVQPVSYFIFSLMSIAFVGRVKSHP
jgi:hypothetical protein